MRLFQNNNRFSFFLQEIMELFEISPLTGIKVLKLIKRLGRPILKKKKKKKKKINFIIAYNLPHLLSVLARKEIMSKQKKNWKTNIRKTKTKVITEN